MHRIAICMTELIMATLTDRFFVIILLDSYRDFTVLSVTTLGEQLDAQ